MRFYGANAIYFIQFYGTRGTFLQKGVIINIKEAGRARCVLDKRMEEVMNKSTKGHLVYFVICAAVVLVLRLIIRPNMTNGVALVIGILIALYGLYLMLQEKKLNRPFFQDEDNSKSAGMLNSAVILGIALFFISSSIVSAILATVVFALLIMFMHTSQVSKKDINAAEKSVKSTVESAKDDVKEGTMGIKEVIEEKAGEIKKKAVELKDAAEEKAKEAKDAIEEKTEEVKDKAEETAEEGKEKAKEAKDKVEKEAKDAKKKVEKETKEVKGKAEGKAKEAEGKAKAAKGKAEGKAKEVEGKAKAAKGKVEGKAKEAEGNVKEKAAEAKKKA